MLSVLTAAEKVASAVIGSLLGAFLVGWVATGHNLGPRRGNT